MRLSVRCLAYRPIISSHKVSLISMKLQLSKIAFLASRTLSAESVLRCYDWVTEQKQLGRCVVSGFSFYTRKRCASLPAKNKNTRNSNSGAYSLQKATPRVRSTHLRGVIRNSIRQRHSSPNPANSSAMQRIYCIHSR